MVNLAHGNGGMEPYLIMIDGVHGIHTQVTGRRCDLPSLISWCMIRLALILIILSVKLLSTFIPSSYTGAITICVSFIQKELLILISFCSTTLLTTLAHVTPVIYMCCVHKNRKWSSKLHQYHEVKLLNL